MKYQLLLKVRPAGLWGLVGVGVFKGIGPRPGRGLVSAKHAQPACGLCFQGKQLFKNSVRYSFLNFSFTPSSESKCQWKCTCSPLTDHGMQINFSAPSTLTILYSIYSWILGWNYIFSPLYFSVGSAVDPDQWLSSHTSKVKSHTLAHYKGLQDWASFTCGSGSEEEQGSQNH